MPVEHYENFPVASCLLPGRMRRPIEAVYRFARGADDIADEGEASDEERLRGLANYADELERIGRGECSKSAAFAELASVVAEWKLPLGLFRDLLDAFAQDVVKKRYADYPELLDYCRRSANPVGRLVLHVFGRAGEENLRRSDAICSALQLINFWQDVELDWAKGRVYLPQEDIVRFGVREETIAERRCVPEWTALMDFQVERSRRLMLAGAPLSLELPGRLGWEIRLTVQGGLRILERIQRARGDVFRHRPTLGPADWLRMAGRAAFMRRKASTS
ncbi:MAG: squalene synthase HpnC [Candidatus Accumulibacter sp.]|jgi:squalene synthase HpnC|nr:squalene synthase HpnC [Accumulibacter sp.]